MVGFRGLAIINTFAIPTFANGEYLTSIRMMLPNTQAGTRPRGDSNLQQPAAVEGATLFNLGGLIESVSPSLERLFGYSPEELIGRSMSLLIPQFAQFEGCDTSGSRRLLQSGAADGVFQNAVGRHKDGAELPLRVSIVEIDARSSRRLVAIIQTLADFSEPVRSELTPRAAEGRLQQPPHREFVAMALGDSQGRFREVNDAFVRMTGYSREELLGSRTTWTQLLADSGDKSAGEALEDIFSRGAGQPCEREYVCKDGTRVPVLLSWLALSGREGDRWILVLDKFPRKREFCSWTSIHAEQDVREMTAALANAVEGIARKDEGGRYVTVNRSYARMFGFEPEELDGKSWLAHVHASDRGTAQAAYRLMQSTGKAEFEGRAVHRDGSVFFVHVLMSRVVDRDGAFLGHYCFIRDITERKECERRIAELGIQEQQRVGRDLHDGLAQELAGLGYMARSLVRRLAGTDAASMAADLGDGIQRALKEVRAIVKGLAPVEIDADGLKSALEEMATNLERRYETPVDFRCRQAVPVKNNSTATHLYRIAQEAAHNALQHARAKKIQVTLQSDRGQLTLTVRDDGIGYRPATGHNIGMGLQIMRHRASMIGAELDIGPALEGGTVVTCTLTQKE